MKIFNNNKQMKNGFTLIEVLVALLVMSVGLLGLAALQATSLQTNHGAFNRGQAIFLAYDIMDRMRANQTQALAGEYNIALGNGPQNNTGNLSQNDLNDWFANLQTALPGGDAIIVCPVAGNNTVCQVTIVWNESRIGGTTSNIDVDGDNTTTEFIFNSKI